jgi:predicted RNA-binding protein associated with RNAse of E/G family
VLAIWNGDWQLLHWYINLESDLVRTDAGFEYEDHVLDVIVDADLKSWRWKDEDELEAALERGLFTREQGAAFYAEGERAVAWLIARQAPYHAAWEDWRPRA